MNDKDGERVRDEGYRSARDGQPVESNPYTDVSEGTYRALWTAGYRDYIRTHPRGSVSTAWANMMINGKAR